MVWHRYELVGVNVPVLLPEPSPRFFHNRPKAQIIENELTVVADASDKVRAVLAIVVVRHSHHSVSFIKPSATPPEPPRPAALAPRGGRTPWRSSGGARPPPASLRR